MVSLMPRLCAPRAPVHLPRTTEIDAGRMI